MRGTWISAAAAVAIMLDAAGYAAAQQKQAGQDPAPGAQSAAPSQEKKDTTQSAKPATDATQSAAPSQEKKPMDTKP